MTKITVIREDGIYRKVRVVGHAGFAPEGKDIVCAALSVLVINTVNSIDCFTGDLYLLDTDEKQGLIQIEFPATVSDRTSLLIDSLCLGAEQLEKDYGRRFVWFDFKER